MSRSSKKGPRRTLASSRGLQSRVGGASLRGKPYIIGGKYES